MVSVKKNTDRSFQDKIQEISSEMSDTQKERFGDFLKNYTQTMEENDLQKARRLIKDKSQDLADKQMHVKNARLWDQALRILESEMDKKPEQKKTKKAYGLTAQFAKVAALGGGAFLLSATFGAPVAAVTISLSAISLVRKSWKKVQEEKIRLSNDGQSTLGPSLGREVKKSIKEKVQALRNSGQELAQTTNKARDYQASEGLSLTRAFARAAWDNKGHIAVITGAVAGLALKVSGMGDWAFDGISSTDIPSETSGQDAVNDQTASNQPVSFEEVIQNINYITDHEPIDIQNDSPSGTGDSESPPPEIAPEPEPAPTSPESELTPEQTEKIQSAGLPIPEDADPELQHRLAEILPHLDSLSPENQQYISELYERMASEDPNIQAQAYKDYAHLALNCMDGIEGLDNDALAWDLINQACDMGEQTNAQAMDFKAYMLMHGIGVDADLEQAADLLMDSYEAHESREALRLLSHIQENNLVSPDMLTAFTDIAEQSIDAPETDAPESGNKEGNESTGEKETLQNTPSTDPSTELPEEDGPEEKGNAEQANPVQPLDHNNSGDVSANDLIPEGTDFKIKHADALMNCTSLEDTSVTRAAIEISTDNYESFECTPEPT